MARKTLLTESELRRFMKLANMRPVGEERIHELGDSYGDREKADPEALEDYAAGDLERGEPGEAAADELEADAELDVPMDEPMDPMDGPAALDSGTEELLAKGIQAMADAMGMSDLVTVDVDGGDDGAMPDDEVQVDVTDVEMAEPELGGEEGGDVSLQPDEPMMQDVEELEEEVEELDEDVEELDESNEEDIVAEVARRVAARLQREAKQAEVVDQLAERIMKRLTK